VGQPSVTSLPPVVCTPPALPDVWFLKTKSAAQSHLRSHLATVITTRPHNGQKLWCSPQHSNAIVEDSTSAIAMPHHKPASPSKARQMGHGHIPLHLQRRPSLEQLQTKTPSRDRRNKSFLQTHNRTYNRKPRVEICRRSRFVRWRNEGSAPRAIQRMESASRPKGPSMFLRRQTRVWFSVPVLHPSRRAISERFSRLGFGWLLCEFDRCRLAADERKVAK